MRSAEGSKTYNQSRRTSFESSTTRNEEAERFGCGPTGAL